MSFHWSLATLIHGILYSIPSETSMDLEITGGYFHNPDSNSLGSSGTHNSGGAGSSRFDSQGSTLMELARVFLFYFHVKKNEAQR